MAELPPLPPGFKLDNQPASDIPPLPPGFTIDSAPTAQPQSGPRPYNPFANDASALPPLPGEQTYDPLGKAPPRPSYFERVNQAAGRFNRAPDTPGLGTLEALGTMLTGGIAAPILGTAESVALGTDPEESFARYTYQPRTESGRAQLGLLGAVVSPITESGTDIALAPLLAGESRALAGPAKIPPNAGRNSPGAPRLPAQSRAVDGPTVAREANPAVASQAGAAGLESVPQANTAAIQSGRELGYKFKPSESGAKGGAVVEGLTGSAKLETALVVKNHGNTQRVIRHEFGIKDGPITPQVINTLKQPHNRIYQEVGDKLGDVPTDVNYSQDILSIGRTPGKSFREATDPQIERLKEAYAGEKQFNAKDAVLEVRKLRAAANKNIKAPNDPGRNELGYAQKAIADAIESQMERYGQSIGQGDLITRFRAARQELAKIHSLDAATKGGEVSAPLLAKQLNKGVPLSGNMRKVAELANEFPNIMRDGRAVKGNTPVNMTETLVAGIGAATIDPTMLTALAVRPVARSVLMSDTYQNRLAPRGFQKANAIAKQEEKRNALLEY